MAELGDSPEALSVVMEARLPPGHQGARCHLLVCVTGPCCEKLLLWCGNQQQTHLHLKVCFLRCALRAM